MKAIILAAGKGERLQPLTNDKPKCLVDLFGKNILRWQIDTYHECNIHDITVVTGYKNNLITYSDAKYLENKDYEETNMVETMFCAKNELKDTVIVSYGDIIFEKNVLQKLIDSDEDFSVIIDKNWEKYWKMRFPEPLHDAESLTLDDNNFINDIGQKVDNINEIQGQYIGLVKFQNDAVKFIIDFYEKLKKIPDSEKNPLNPEIPFRKSFMTDFLRGLINAKCKVKAIPIHGGWLELDSIKDYNLYQKKFEDNSINDLICLERLGKK